MTSPVVFHHLHVYQTCDIGGFHCMEKPGVNAPVMLVLIPHSTGKLIVHN